MHPLVELSDLHRVYPAGGRAAHALRGVNLRVEHGDFVALMGASGSGKSTLLNIAGGLDRPTSGVCRVNGVETSPAGHDRADATRDDEVGFVFPGFNFLPRASVLENIELPLLCRHRTLSATAMRERAALALARVGLAGLGDRSPADLTDEEKQRVATARALVGDPRLLLADDPARDLGPREAISLMDLFQQLNEQGLAIVLVTHELALARFCRRIALLRAGRIVSDRPVKTRAVAALARACLDLDASLGHE